MVSAFLIRQKGKYDSFTDLYGNVFVMEQSEVEKKQLKW